MFFRQNKGFVVFSNSKRGQNVTAPTSVLKINYLWQLKCEYDPRLISNSRDFRTRLFSNHACFRDMLIQNFHEYFDGSITPCLQIYLRTTVSNAEVICHAYFQNNAYSKASQFWGVHIFETVQCLLSRIYGIIVVSSVVLGSG